MNAEEIERVLGQRNDRLWDLLQRDWAGDQPQRWKMLACLHLRIHCRWQLEMIGRALGHTRGHVLRLVTSTLSELQTRYAGDREHWLRGDDRSGPARLPTSPAELDRRIATCQEELDVWQRLRQQQSKIALWGTDDRLRIIPGSLRERIAHLLADDRPRRSSQIALELRVAAQKVRRILWECPEFLSDSEGIWSLHHFAGQECLGDDVETVPANRTAAGDQP